MIYDSVDLALFGAAQLSLGKKDHLLILYRSFLL